MKKLLLGSVALAALGLGAPANAADMRARPLPPPVPAFSWNGCYVGFYGGYATGQSQHSTSGNAAVGTPFGAVNPIFPEAPTGGTGDLTDKFDMSGFVGGGTGGCQWQAGVWVFGIEGDGGVTNKDGQAHDLSPFNPIYVSQTTERWTSTARLRLGYAVDKWLFYVTGGAAWAGVEATAWNGNGQPPAGVASVVTAGFPAIHHKQVMFGYTVGAGTEYALSYGWSIKSEYLFTQYSDKDFFNAPDSFNPSLALFVRPHSVSLYNHTFKWGLNYKFDFGKAPVVVSK
jgi:outer membrane immunogenic protein